MNNLRDLLGYALDTYDVLLFEHRFYAYCKLVANTFVEQDTAVARLIEPRFSKMLMWRNGVSRKGTR